MYTLTVKCLFPEITSLFVSPAILLPRGHYIHCQGTPRVPGVRGLPHRTTIVSLDLLTPLSIHYDTWFVPYVKECPQISHPINEFSSQYSNILRLNSSMSSRSWGRGSESSLGGCGAGLRSSSLGFSPSRSSHILRQRFTWLWKLSRKHKDANVELLVHDESKHVIVTALMTLLWYWTWRQRFTNFVSFRLLNLKTNVHSWQLPRNLDLAAMASSGTLCGKLTAKPPSSLHICIHDPVPNTNLQQLLKPCHCYDPRHVLLHAVQNHLQYPVQTLHFSCILCDWFNKVRQASTRFSDHTDEVSHH